MTTDKDRVIKTDAEWRALLTPEQYDVARCSSTEPPFRNKYWDHHDSGTYVCICCGAELFDSDTKFDSGTGWPSFAAPIDDGGVKMVQDDSHGMSRVEVICGRCDAHLGHVFDSHQTQTGLRYCMNSASLDFEPRD